MANVWSSSRFAKHVFSTFAFAKHVMVMNKGKDLRAQYELLESLPVGIDSIQDELDKTASQ